MTGPRHLRLVPPPRPTPEIKDITGTDTPCDCVCGLWVHSGICTEYATVEEASFIRIDGTPYRSCQPCYDDMLRKAADL